MRFVVVYLGLLGLASFLASRAVLQYRLNQGRQKFPTRKFYLTFYGSVLCLFPALAQLPFPTSLFAFVVFGLWTTMFVNNRQLKEMKIEEAALRAINQELKRQVDGEED